MIKMQIFTPYGHAEYSADAVFLPGMYSPFEVLPGHAPIISTLEAGIIRWVKDGEEDSMRIRNGVVRFAVDKMEICAEEEEA